MIAPYKHYLSEIGFRFSNEITSELVKSLYTKLLDLPEFNGVNKVSNIEEKRIAFLSSDDNCLELTISQRDISLINKNHSLSRDFRFNNELIKQLILDLYERTKEHEVDAVRSTQFIYSTKKSDFQQVVSNVFSTKHSEELDEFDVTFERENENSNISKNVLINVTDQYSEFVYNAFAKKDQLKLLDNFINIITVGSMFDQISKKDMTDFLAYALTDKLHDFALESLGYERE